MDCDSDEEIARIMSWPASKRQRLLDELQKAQRDGVELVDDVWAVILSFATDNLVNVGRLNRVSRHMRGLVKHHRLFDRLTLVDDRLRVHVYRLCSREYYTHNALAFPHATRGIREKEWTVRSLTERKDNEWPDWFRFGRGVSPDTPRLGTSAFSSHDVHIHSGIIYSQSNVPMTTIFEADALGVVGSPLHGGFGVYVADKTRKGKEGRKRFQELHDAWDKKLKLAPLSTRFLKPEVHLNPLGAVHQRILDYLKSVDPVEFTEGMDPGAVDKHYLATVAHIRTLFEAYIRPAL